MSWQEELRKLDEELASGRLSADDYRVRRDQVLSSAVAHGEDPAAAAQNPQQPGQQDQQPQQQQPQQPEQQPSQGQQTGGPTADSTQVIAPVNNPVDPGAERTQAVPPWQAQQPQQPPYAQPQQPMQQPGPASPAGGFQQQGPASPAGGFQQQGPASPAGGFQQQGPASPAGGFHQPPQQRPWNAPDADQSPPWGGTDFPPIAPPPSNEWAAQGPEGFDDKPKGGKGKIFAIVGAVVVLAGIAVTAFLLWGTGDDNAQGGGDPSPTNPPASSQQQSQAPEDSLPIGSIDGQEETHDEIKTFADVVDKTTYLNKDEVEAYQRTNPTDAKFAVYHLDNGNVAVVLLTKVGDAGAASDEVSNLTYIQTTNGAQRVLDGVPDDVFLTSWDDPNGKTVQLRGHYLADDVLVRIEVRGESSMKQVRDDFDQALEAEQEVLPSGD